MGSERYYGLCRPIGLGSEYGEGGAMARYYSRHGRLALLTVLLLHMAATCYVIPPAVILRDTSLPSYDYPIHTHRVYLYREALWQSGLPWGYDPHLSAGVVVDPAQDPGKPQQVLGVLLPFLNPGSVVALFAFMTLLLAPFPLLLALRHLKLPLGMQAWIMIAVLTGLWLMNGLLYDFMVFGIVAYLAAVFLSPWVMTSFLQLIELPNLGRYSRFSLGGALLFFMHGVGPVALVVPIAFYTLWARPLAIRWRVAIMLTPVIMAAINAFWCVPWLLALQMPRPPWLPVPVQLLLKDFQFQSWAESAAYFTMSRTAIYVVGVGAAVAGLVAMARAVGRHAAVAFGLAGFSCLFLSVFGSFIPVISHIQPLRMLIPATVFLGIPVGVLIEVSLSKIAISSEITAVIVAVELAALSVAQGWLHSMPQTSASDTLVGFVENHTSAEDRLLIQSVDHQAKAMAMALRREVIGSTYPEINDPIQFKTDVVFGKPLHTWRPAELHNTLQRYGITFVFTRTDEAGSLLANTLSTPGESLGLYRVFPVLPSTGRFLIGDGQVKATLNRLELSRVRPEGGLIVLRYRYHPAWRTATGQPVQRYPVPGELAGFIALRDPPTELRLEFSPWAMLWTPWPALTK
jgi:hypothetical protein